MTCWPAAGGREGGGRAGGGGGGGGAAGRLPRWHNWLARSGGGCACRGGTERQGHRTVLGCNRRSQMPEDRAPFCKHRAAVAAARRVVSGDGAPASCSAGAGKLLRLVELSCRQLASNAPRASSSPRPSSRRLAKQEARMLASLGCAGGLAKQICKAQLPPRPANNAELAAISCAVGPPGASLSADARLLRTAPWPVLVTLPDQLSSPSHCWSTSKAPSHAVAALGGLQGHLGRPHSHARPHWTSLPGHRRQQRVG